MPSQVFRRTLHFFGRHTWELKGFGEPRGRCFCVWHCRYCDTSCTKAIFDDPIIWAGRFPFSLTWEATNPNQVGAEQGVGVYSIRDNKMVKI